MQPEHPGRYLQELYSTQLKRGRNGLKTFNLLKAVRRDMGKQGFFAFLPAVISSSIGILRPRRWNVPVANLSFGLSLSLLRNQSRLLGIGVLCAVFFYPLGAWGQTSAPANESQVSQGKPAWSGYSDYGMPERLGRQVAPTPSEPWRSPDLRSYTSVLKSAERSPIDPQKRYKLVELDRPR